LRNRLVSLSLALLWMMASSSVSFMKAARQTTAPNGQGVAKTPNLSGVWMERETRNTFTDQEPPMQPWAKAKYDAAKPGYGPRASAQSQDPVLSCLPPGVPRIMLIPFPMQIVQTPGLIVMIFEYDHFVRQIYLDRRDHPKDLDLTWLGDSIGRWEKDTLVVDTVGLTDKTWLDQVGHPHSDRLHVVERIRRADHDTLEDDITIDDPKAYTKPWTGQQVFKLRPNWHLIEYVCEDMEPLNK
jgi:hypothetical protein